jgi:hypothetical protein
VSSPSNVPLMRLCLDRSGSFLRASKLVAFTIAWGSASAEVPDLTVSTYAEYWGQNIRSASREMRLFKQSFPELDTPSDLLAMMDDAPAAATVDVSHTALA